MNKANIIDVIFNSTPIWVAVPVATLLIGLVIAAFVYEYFGKSNKN